MFFARALREFLECACWGLGLPGLGQGRCGANALSAVRADIRVRSVHLTVEFLPPVPRAREARGPP
jgi:hypothetical protein